MAWMAKISAKLPVYEWCGAKARNVHCDDENGARAIEILAIKSLPGPRFSSPPLNRLHGIESDSHLQVWWESEELLNA